MTKNYSPMHEYLNAGYFGHTHSSKGISSLDPGLLARLIKFCVLIPIPDIARDTSLPLRFSPLPFNYFTDVILDDEFLFNVCPILKIDEFI